jgi:purine-nucleoside phosphorylase
VSASGAQYDLVRRAAAWLSDKGIGVPPVGVVLGSGLGDFTARLVDPLSISYADIPGWPPSAIVGHAGRLVVGTLAGRRVAALSGRAHVYEGHDYQTVAFPTRVLGVLGVRVLVLTNAAGGIDARLTPGTLMLIEDHINLMGGNPLTGPNDDRFGPRFPDMTEVYSRRLRGIAQAAADARGVALGRGVYAALHGPSYETPAEIRYLRTIGADAVGMSTVPEALVGRHMGMEVLGISCITNAAAGVLPSPLDHDEVMAVAARVKGEFGSLVEGIIERL